MAKGKDALSYALSTFLFSSINFQNEIIKKYWEEHITNFSSIPLNKNIENPFQQVKLYFADESFEFDGESPEVIIFKNSITPENKGEIILETSSGEDCARLLCISHTIAQRFCKPICLVISKECLNENLISSPEHIPFPPIYEIRDQSWKPDSIRLNHPALNFKRINYGENMGPRDRASLLIISHGKNSSLINNLINESKIKNKVRHLEIQTLRPISNEILLQAMQSVKKTVVLNDTFKWLEKNNLIESIELNQLKKLLS